MNRHHEATLKTVYRQSPFLGPTCGVPLDILSASSGWDLESAVLSPGGG